MVNQESYCMTCNNAVKHDTAPIMSFIKKLLGK